MLYVNRLEDIEMARFHALAQIIVDKEKGVEAFERYTKIAFPGFESRKRRTDDDFKKQLRDWVKTGPLKVTPMQTPQGKSRMKTRATKVLKDSRLGSLYDRMNRYGDKS